MENRASPDASREKRPFDIQLVLSRIRTAVAPYPKAALFQLAEEGLSTVFQQLVACVLSIRTFDEVTAPVARRLLAVAPTPETMSKLTVGQIEALIHECTFHDAKAAQIHEIARRAVTEMGGEIPCDEAVLRSFKGVGPKCAALVLGIACGQPGVSVDIHVYRVVNRWGYVSAKTPEKTMLALQERLPRESWIELNSLLVPFGKHVCTGTLPRCSTCPVQDMCRQIGVVRHR